MLEIVLSKHDFCTGCNRCVRECPMETANITYQDDDGSIKVKIDHDKCITCGRCISACKHNARYYIDDTSRFFDDLSKGIPISLIAAPAIRTNIPEYKRLFTYLKQLGVNKIYDVSLGADICIWAYIRHLEKTNFAPVIAQPCPAIVKYCKIYHHDLLKKLSPVHSPMSCTSVYMKEYEGIKDNIAALSPCIAKGHEFELTGLAQYNVTFSGLQKYLQDNNIQLPDFETGFDHRDGSIGSLFPMPGGLTENVEFYYGKKISIDRAEGFNVYEKLNAYIETPEEFLPKIFDVLNCDEGCNIGTACSYVNADALNSREKNKANIFKINRTMDKSRETAAAKGGREYFDSVFKSYDNKLNLSHFLRKYKALPFSLRQIIDKDIEEAFLLLGKTDYEKQNVDCGACGSNTCHDMARKIALGVNIPINCIHKSMEDAKKEHEENLAAHEQIVTMEKLRQADELMRTMLTANPNINILFNSRMQVVDCNPAAISFMGFNTKEEMIAGFMSRISEYIPEYQSDGKPSVPLVERFMTVAMEENLRFETEVIVNGEMRNLDFTLKRIPYENNFAIVANVIDTTDIHVREKQLTTAREQNELQLAKLNMVILATKIGLWDMEVNREDPMNVQNIFYWSDEFRRMLGFEDENDFPNLLGSFTRQVHPDDLERVNTHFKKHLLDRTGNTAYDIEYRAIRKDGEYRYFRACGETIRDEDGYPLRVAGALMDITEDKNILLESQRLREEAEEANKAKSLFLSTMSHEIRTPMNAILGITEIQLQYEDIDPKIRGALEKIYTSGDMLLGIINDILDLSKIEAGKMELLIDKYEIPSLLSDTIQLNMMRIGSKAIEFELDVDENTPVYLLGDELRVKQIFNNLLSNAFKYTKEGVVKLSICAKPSDTEDEIFLVISVKDTGQGMTKEQVDKLFDEYSRFNLQANRTTEGTGLGMAITRNLVHMMDGRIDIESEPGKGSTFTVFLSQKTCGDEVIGEEIADNLRKFRTTSRSQMKRVQISRDPMPYGSVLVVDDVEINIYVAKGLLSAYKLKVDSAASGYAALEKIKSGNVYDIVFMDHMMPEMDGIETTKKIRALGYKHPIVALTANAVAGQAEHFFNNGFDDYISKPIDVRQLNNVLNKLIRDKQPPDVIEEARKQADLQNGHSENNDQHKDLKKEYAEIFVRDAVKAITVLEAFVSNDKIEKESMRKYEIQVHGMKSALANIGNTELSSAADKLEMYAKNGDIDKIASKTEDFISSLKKLVNELTPKEEKDCVEINEEDKKYLREKLFAIKEACEAYDETAASAVISEIETKKRPAEVNKLLSVISEHLLHSDFEEAAEAVNKYLETM